MKIDRLIGILSILLQREQVTAPYLAEKFEVSRRTINRDLEDLSKAGIPLFTTQGRGGGIRIMDGYRIDRTLLTSSDMQAILSGLKSLDSVSGTSRYQQLMEKLSAGTSNVLSARGHIVIDLASWYKSTLTPKIELIQQAIDKSRTLRFDYYAPGGESRREIEPYLLVFHWTSWYVWGYCTEKSDYRLFKLNRVQKLELTGHEFIPRNAPQPDLSSNRIFPCPLEATVLLSPSMKWRLIEEYGIESFSVLPDGRLLFHWGFSGKESLFGWILSFGADAELTAPESLRREFAELLGTIRSTYTAPAADADIHRPPSSGE